MLVLTALASLAGLVLSKTLNIGDLLNEFFGNFVAVSGDAHQAKVAQDIFRQQIRYMRSVQIREDIRDANKMMMESVQTTIMMGSIVLGVCFTMAIEGCPPFEAHRVIVSMWVVFTCWAVTWTLIALWLALRFQMKISTSARERLLRRHRFAVPDDLVIGRMGGNNLVTQVANLHNELLVSINRLATATTSDDATDVVDPSVVASTFPKDTEKLSTTVQAGLPSDERDGQMAGALPVDATPMCKDLNAWLHPRGNGLTKHTILDVPFFLVGETLVRSPWLCGKLGPPLQHIRVHGPATLYVAAQCPPRTASADSMVAFSHVGSVSAPSSGADGTSSVSTSGFAGVGKEMKKALRLHDQVPAWPLEEMPQITAGFHECWEGSSGYGEFRRVEGFSIFVSDSDLELPLYKIVLADPGSDGHIDVVLNWRFKVGCEALLVILRRGKIHCKEEDWPLAEFNEEMKQVLPLRYYSGLYFRQGLGSLLLATCCLFLGRLYVVLDVFVAWWFEFVVASIALLPALAIITLLPADFEQTQMALSMNAINESSGNHTQDRVTNTPSCLSVIPHTRRRPKDVHRAEASEAPQSSAEKEAVDDHAVVREPGSDAESHGSSPPTNGGLDYRPQDVPVIELSTASTPEGSLCLSLDRNLAGGRGDAGGDCSGGRGAAGNSRARAGGCLEVRRQSEEKTTASMVEEQLEASGIDAVANDGGRGRFVDGSFWRLQQCSVEMPTLPPPPSSVAETASRLGDTLSVGAVATVAALDASSRLLGGAGRFCSDVVISPAQEVVRAQCGEDVFAPSSSSVLSTPQTLVRFGAEDSRSTRQNVLDVNTVPHMSGGSSLFAFDGSTGTPQELQQSGAEVVQGSSVGLPAALKDHASAKSTKTVSFSTNLSKQLDKELTTSDYSESGEYHSEVGGSTDSHGKLTDFCCRTTMSRTSSQRSRGRCHRACGRARNPAIRRIQRCFDTLRYRASTLSFWTYVLQFTFFSSLVFSIIASLLLHDKTQASLRPPVFGVATEVASPLAWLVWDVAWPTFFQPTAAALDTAGGLLVSSGSVLQTFRHVQATNKFSPLQSLVPIGSPMLLPHTARGLSNIDGVRGLLTFGQTRISAIRVANRGTLTRGTFNRSSLLSAVETAAASIEAPSGSSLDLPPRLQPLATATALELPTASGGSSGLLAVFAVPHGGGIYFCRVAAKALVTQVGDSGNTIDSGSTTASLDVGVGGGSGALEVLMGPLEPVGWASAIRKSRRFASALGTASSDANVGVSQGLGTGAVGPEAAVPTVGGLHACVSGGCCSADGRCADEPVLWVAIVDGPLVAIGLASGGVLGTYQLPTSSDSDDAGVRGSGRDSGGHVVALAGNASHLIVVVGRKQGGVAPHVFSTAFPSLPTEAASLAGSAAASTTDGHTRR
eukprot:TRINITY_DN30558_c0_g1_i1.p1 TRINITY_DN30558_c0_g1~~TRINITY_DN30558_c0_g1_i1.p1  ORF type:complete len:1404 (+),score=206.19 TRINITY_DN30558_c0_g1_i1:95-4306(+)